MTKVVRWQPPRYPKCGFKVLQPSWSVCKWAWEKSILFRTVQKQFRFFCEISALIYSKTSKACFLASVRCPVTCILCKYFGLLARVFFSAPPPASSLRPQSWSFRRSLLLTNTSLRGCLDHDNRPVCFYPFSPNAFVIPILSSQISWFTDALDDFQQQTDSKESVPRLEKPLRICESRCVESVSFLSDLILWQTPKQFLDWILCVLLVIKKRKKNGSAENLLTADCIQ